MKIIKFICLILLVFLWKDNSLGLFVNGLENGMSSTIGLDANIGLMKHKNYFAKLKHKEKDKLNGEAKAKDYVQVSSSQNGDSLNYSQDKTDKTIENIVYDAPKMPIYFQGWMKYLKLNDDLETDNKIIKLQIKSKPKQFFKNDFFDKQDITKIKNSEMKIPSELHFFTILYKNSLNIFSSRDDTFRRVVDVLNIDDVVPIAEGGHLLGGVRDFGKFNEGSCFFVFTVEPQEQFIMSKENLIPKNGINRKWIFCLDSDEAKKNLMNLIENFKLEKQHNLGLYLQKDKTGKVNETKETLLDLAKKSEKQLDNYNTKHEEISKDGYSVVIQEWSQCTLKCGGGLEHQQLACMPPKGKGKPCEGQSVRTRPCNTQPCPTFNKSNEDVNMVLKGHSINVESKLKDDTFLPPMIKMMPISKRLNRYEKCLIKEGDALLIKSDNIMNTYSSQSKSPVRIVLNDKTFSIYNDDQFTNLLLSIPLKNLLFSRIKGNQRCFVISTPAKVNTQLCQLDSDSHDWLEEWDYDINLFKYQCYTPISKSETYLSKGEESKMQKLLNEGVEEIKIEIVKEKAQQVKQKIQEEEELQVQNKIKQFRETSFKALQKEIRIEKMLEKEEEIKELEETKEIEKQIDREKKKNESLVKAIKEKELEDQFNISRRRSEEAILEIAKEAKQKVAQRRLQIKKKIAEMKKRQEWKKKELEHKLIGIRTAMAEQLSKVSKIGKIELCFVPKSENDAKAIEYCEYNFVDDFKKFQECKSVENFCYVCCENEFGELHLLERDKCYNKCDKSS